MVKEQLTDEMIEAGAELTRQLDARGLPFTIAMWFFEEETNEWRLFYGSDQVGVLGPLKFYEEIYAAHEAMGAMGERLPLTSVRLLSPVRERFHILKNRLHTSEPVSKIRITKDYINGQYVDDALVYRYAA